MPWFLLPLLSACAPDLFRVAGYEQERFTNRADLLFVLDPSPALAPEHDALKATAGPFLDDLTGEAADIGTDGLVDAVENYIDFAARRTEFVDFHLAVTRTDAEATWGALEGEVLRFGDPDPEPAFVAAIEAATASPRAGPEEGLEALFMTLCRGVEEPPLPCFDPLNQFLHDDIGTAAPLFRPGATFLPVILRAEGDHSRRKDTGEDWLPDEYEALYELFDLRMIWTVIAPDDEACAEEAPVAPEWALARYAHFVEASDGLWIDLADPAEGCARVDFEEVFERLGALIDRLRTVFVLQAVPDPGSLHVFVDDAPAARATADDDGAWTDGWSYDPAQNAVVFHGAAVPDYAAEVRIYYLPLSGKPRDLPF